MLRRVIVVAAWWLSGCSAGATQCRTLVIVTPIITVTDGSTGAYICDATIVPSDSSQPLQSVPPQALGQSVCTYGGSSLGQVGTRSLEVSKQGYGSVMVANVTTQEGGCIGNGQTPAAQSVHVVLTPQ